MVVVSKPSKIRIHLDPQDLLTVQGDSGTQIPDDDSRWNTHELSKTKDFITLDAKNGFYQIGLDEKNRRKTTFWTAFGRSKYLILESIWCLPPQAVQGLRQERKVELWLGSYISWVLTIYTRKREIPVRKSNSSRHSVWEASENMGCNMRWCYFSTLISLPSWCGYIL